MFRGCIDDAGDAYGNTSKFAATLDNGATFPSTAELFTSGKIDDYDMLIFSCEGHRCTDLQTTANIATLEAYENKGGRVFLDHVHYNWINHSERPDSGRRQDKAPARTQRARSPHKST